MQNHARELKYKAFLSHVDKKELEKLFPHYHWKPGRNRGLRMKDDWAVSYWKSVYDSKPCVYVVHSCIEYVFV